MRASVLSGLKRRLIFYASVLVLPSAALFYATSMPGKSYSGTLPPTTPELRELAVRLRRDVTMLAGTIGSRSLERKENLDAARAFLVARLMPLESASRKLQFEQVVADGAHAENVIFEVAGNEYPSIVLVGAHYDSVATGPGANDNGSGVAVTLELASRFANAPAPSNVRFVFFVNEEPPHFQRPGMGSWVDADNARKRQDRIRAMLSLETIGCFNDQAGSQHYPFPIGLLYPSRGNFLAFVGDLGARSLVRTAIAAFRSAEPFPSEGAALPAAFPGVDWSDHWSFRRAGYPAIMLTDTAVYRDPNYHQPSDRPEALSYDSLARVTRGIEAIVRTLAR